MNHNDYSNIIKNISSILWAYTFNRPLKYKSVSLITNIILENLS